MAEPSESASDVPHGWTRPKGCDVAGKLAVIGAGLMGSGIAQVSAQAWLGRRPAGRHRPGADPRARLREGVVREVRRQGQADRGRRRGRARPHHHHHRPGRRRGRRRRGRGRVREARGQARDLPHPRQGRARGHRPRLQHLRHPDHQDRGRDGASGARRRRPLLLAGTDDAALRTRPRLQDQRRNPGHRKGVRRVGRQDLHRRQP